MTPKHVAIICDGNRRWAKENKLQAVRGHRKAVDDTFEPLIDCAIEQGIEYLTFWVFSTENWNRESAEVQALLELFRELLGRQIQQLHDKGIRLEIIGDISKFDDDIQQKVKDGVELTKNNDKITVVFAMNYGGRDEILRAVNHLVSDAYEDGRAAREECLISEEDFSEKLDTAGMPDPDFIIRTGGEQRLSGFMLWQSNYAELAFPDFYFPEFTPERFLELLADYAHRKRRFGK